VFLVPQVANARRLSISLDAYPSIVRIDAALWQEACVADSAPDRQPDAPAA
jgi:hypothetical protein